MALLMSPDKRRYKHRRLPVGYQEVEWIENPNKGYFNTGIRTDVPNAGYEVTYQMTQGNEADDYGQFIWGFYSHFGNIHNGKATATQDILYWRNSAEKVIISTTSPYHDDGAPSSNILTRIHAFDENKHTVRVEALPDNSGLRIYHNGDLLVTATSIRAKIYQYDDGQGGDYRAQYSFGTYNNNPNTGNVGIAKPFTGKVMDMKILDRNNETSHEFIPAIRQSDNVAGFYEIYSNTFWASQRANCPFVAGPAVMGGVET